MRIVTYGRNEKRVLMAETFTLGVRFIDELTWEYVYVGPGGLIPIRSGVEMCIDQICISTTVQLESGSSALQTMAHCSYSLKVLIYRIKKNVIH